MGIGAVKISGQGKGTGAATTETVIIVTATGAFTGGHLVPQFFQNR